MENITLKEYKRRKKNSKKYPLSKIEMEKRLRKENAPESVIKAIWGLPTTIEEHLEVMVWFAESMPTEVLAYEIKKGAKKQTKQKEKNIKLFKKHYPDEKEINEWYNTCYTCKHFELKGTIVNEGGDCKLTDKFVDFDETCKKFCYYDTTEE